MRYRIYPLLTGHFTVAFNGKADMKFPKVNDIPSYIFLLVDENGEAVVVDTGFDLEHIPAPDSHGERDPEQEIPFLVKQAGIDPLNVKKIIQTHLHWDHAAGIKHFPNAEIYLQSGEIQGLFNLREFEETSFCPAHWIDRLDSFILFEGNHEILPGIEVIRTGGHTNGHQAVKIKGEHQNILLLGDSPFTYEWLWTLVPGIYWEEYRSGKGRKFFWKNELLPVIDEWYKKRTVVYPQALKDYSIRELQKIGDIQIFSHDPGLKGKKYL
jgi:glyoxylase-like metal-dependent hydrolase (beta-lactamase superfamily II)